MRRLALLLLLCCALHPRGALGQSGAWTRVRPLPAPRGSYPVGTYVLRFTDTTRATSRHISTRPLAVQLWYPAVRGTVAPAPYMPDPALLDSMMAREYLELKARDMVTWRDARLTARMGATPAAAPGRSGWPVLVFSHGMGVSRASYSALAEDLASHGYVVVTIDHPLGGFTLDLGGRVLAPGVDTVAYPDRILARAVRDWALDAAFVLHRLVEAQARGADAAGQTLPLLDTARVGMLGHSLGGAAALQACHDQALFAACVDMDGYPFGDAEQEPVGKPLLTLLSEPDRRGEAPPKDTAEAGRRARFAAMGRERDSTWAAVASRSGAVPWFVVKLTGTGHFSFSDAPFLAPSLLRGVGATMTPARMHSLVSDLLLDFFDHFLRGRPLRLLRPGVAAID